MQEVKIRSFTDLHVWQKSYKLGLDIYKISRTFSKEELYGVTSQLRRAVISVSCNIAEGFARPGQKEKQQFLFIALGSLVETQNLLLLCKDLGYLSKQEFTDLAKETIEISKMLNSSIISLRKYKRHFT